MYCLLPMLAGSGELTFALQRGGPLGAWHHMQTMNTMHKKCKMKCRNTGLPAMFSSVCVPCFSVDLFQLRHVAYNITYDAMFPSVYFCFHDDEGHLTLACSPQKLKQHFVDTGILWCLAPPTVSDNNSNNTVLNTNPRSVTTCQM